MIFAIAICASISYYGYCTMNRNRQILHETQPKQIKELYPNKFKDIKD